MGRYLFNIAVGFDQLGNTLLGGDPDETISSRMGKLLLRRSCVVCRGVCWLLDRLQMNHCVRSIEFDEGKNAAVN